MCLKMRPLLLELVSRLQIPQKMWQKKKIRGQSLERAKNCSPTLGVFAHFHNETFLFKEESYYS